MNKRMLINKKALPIAIAIACVCLFAFVSCGDDEKSKGGGMEYDPSKPVVLTTFHPDSGGIASKVIFDGDNFGSDPGKIKVYFNNKPAPVVGSSGKRMYAVVPRLPGDTCTVSVVVGNDSVVYDHKFRYKISVTVSTIVGNGTKSYTGGTLAEATIGYPKFIAVDNEYNIFVAIADGGTWGMIKINEEENSVIALASNPNGNMWNCQPPGVDPTTGVVTAADDGNQGMFYRFDPKEGWAARVINWKWKEGSQIPAHSWKKNMPTCLLDTCIYVRHWDGDIAKYNPRTNEAEVVYKTPQGESYGAAFHPQHPNLLYLVFDATATGTVSNSVCSLDLTDMTFTKLSGSGRGHRDGELALAQFNDPWQAQFDHEGNFYIADRGNHCIRRITPDNMVETVIGIPGQAGWKDGDKDEALFDYPRGVGVDKDGTVYIADQNNCRIRKLAIE